MNNSIRRLIQRTVEVKKLVQICNFPVGERVLELGCGSGYGTKLIKKHFKPEKISAIDLDERMIKIANKNNTDANITFIVGDATKLPFSNNTFDAVFELGIIHHIPNWRDSIKEIFRVLKPGGQIIIEDLSLETFNSFIGKFLKRFFRHPYSKMYREQEFIDYLTKMRFERIKVKRNVYGAFFPAFILQATKR